MADLTGRSSRQVVAQIAAATPGDGWFLAILASAIVLSGPMIYGYAVMDEIGLYVILALTAGTWMAFRPQRFSGLESLHRWVFLVFMAYLSIQSLRGIAALGDVRIVRFLVLFVAVGTVAWFAPVLTCEVRFSTRLPRIVALAGVVYFAAYICVGAFSEMVLGVTRFALQGHVWSGTSVAVFPVYVMLPALAALAGSTKTGDRRLFWTAYSVILVAGFYYQSRSVWLALLVIIFLSGRRPAMRQRVVAAGFFLCMLTLFPWTDSNFMTPRNLEQSVSNLDLDIVVDRVRRSAGQFEGMVPRWRAPEDTGRSVGKLDLGSADIDRKIAILAALQYVRDGDAWRLLFGNGYYTHRFTLIPVFREFGLAYDYKFPETYEHIVRTATFNAMLADTGVIGIFLLGLLFALTALGIARARGGAKLVSLAALGLIGMTLISSLNYDVVLLYLTLMPRGALLAFHASPADQG